MSKPPALVLFRDDLRLSDNPALAAAVARGQPLLCLFIVDEESAGLQRLGGAAKWWRHFSLADLATRLAAIGGRLDLVRGAAATVTLAVAQASGATACFWNRRYGAAERAVDAATEAALQQHGVVVATFNGTLLHEPADVRSKTGGAFKVYTPYLRASLARGIDDPPLPAPAAVNAAPPLAGVDGLTRLDDLGFLPTKPDWAGGLRETWVPGETQAQALLHAFLESGLPRYGEDRNRPAVPATSRLSPHLRHGEISPRQIVAQARHAAASGRAKPEEVDKFISEVVWRDFAYSLLAEHPDIATVPVQPGFAKFPYRTASSAELEAWQHGRTGYPIVDAGMRQLWITGVMHNRVRMVVASFLIKHMLVDWRIGEAWFWDTLCDADPASNPVNWQWVAGCGVDASPYFRIFNPTLQGEKFDPKGAYVGAFVPELAKLPPKWMHRPWDAPREVLAQAAVVLGESYPRPIVEHEIARDRALKALSMMRAAGQPPRDKPGLGG